MKIDKIREGAPSETFRPSLDLRRIVVLSEHGLHEKPLQHFHKASTNHNERQNPSYCMMKCKNALYQTIQVLSELILPYKPYIRKCY